MDTLSQLLRGAGYEVADGADAVVQMIRDKADSCGTPMCSGYGVLPDGAVCSGCPDCER